MHISDFYLGKCLGEGSFSRVHYARCKRKLYDYSRDFASEEQDTSKVNLFAIKIVNKKKIQRRDRYVSMIMNEKEFLCCLQHKNILTLFATWMSNDNLFFLLELCSSNLTKVMNNMDTFTHERDVLPFRLRCSRYYMLQLLSAIEYLHSHSLCIVHRDIKPDNILIVKNGADQLIKLADFGFATALNKNQCDDLVVHQFLGSPDYSSPEAKTIGSEVSVSFDLWSFGCILFELVTGDCYHSTNFVRATNKVMSDLKSGVDVVNLIQALLVSDRQSRLGVNETFDSNKCTYISIRDHPFFASQEESKDNYYLPNIIIPKSEVVDCSKPSWEFLLERDFT